MYSLKFYFSVFAALILISTACSDDNTPDGLNDDFDRAAMLENMGNNIILPAYEDMEIDISELEQAINSFTSNPNITTLEAAQESLKKARITWQRINLLQFGPAETVALRSFINTFPADTGKIESNIDSGSFTLGTLDNQNAAGFPAMGYLLHGVGDTAEDIVSRYTTAGDAEQRLGYLTDNMDFVQANIEQVINAWKPDGGDNIGTFLSEDNAGTDVGSSLGQLFNASFVVHYERFLRDAKIGIPSGVRSANIPRPGNVEAFYGGYSVELALANLQTVENLYLGRTFEGTDGIGLEENLQALGAEDLDNTVKNEFTEAFSALESLQDPLSAQIDNNNDPVLNAFIEVQDLVGLIKSDIASRLGITITFQDNDGD